MDIFMQQEFLNAVDSILNKIGVCFKSFPLDIYIINTSSGSETEGKCFKVFGAGKQF
jgi:hypothetical protein